jgi:thiol-disulfide isomerase/thioredoxin
MNRTLCATPRSRVSLPLVSAAFSLAFVACAAQKASTGLRQHGTLSSLSVASSEQATFCEHRVPSEVCTRCNPHLIARFKAANDWCGEHDVPESQCYACHPDLSFEPLPKLREGADLLRLSEAGEDVPSLQAHLVRGKVTLFDFYADWCAPCRRIDAHVFRLLNAREDIALRKLNVVSWDTPLAKRHLTRIASLPYVVVYGKNGKLVRAISGFDLAAIDRAISDGGAR